MSHAQSVDLDKHGGDLGGRVLKYTWVVGKVTGGRGGCTLERYRTTSASAPTDRIVSRHGSEEGYKTLGPREHSGSIILWKWKTFGTARNLSRAD